MRKRFKQKVFQFTQEKRSKEKFSHEKTDSRSRSLYINF